MNKMEIGVGFLFILLGFLVVKCPMLISGYNTMPKEKRDKVDIGGLSRMIRGWMIGIGLSFMLASTILNKLGEGGLKEMVTFVIIVGGCLIMVFKAQKYNRN